MAHFENFHSADASRDVQRVRLHSLYAGTCTCIMLLSSYVAFGASSESLVMGIGWLSIYQKQTALAVLSSIICMQLQ